MSPPVFELEHVSVGPADGRRLHDVVASVPSAGLTAIVGPSGAGKSTLLRLCNRLEVPSEGRVLFRGDDVAGIDPLALRRRVGMVFQRPTPFAGTVRDNLRVARPDLDDAAAAAALERVHLDGSFLDRAATELSGGESQRVCLARTLVTEPEVLLADEATSALDPAARLTLERLGRRVAADGVPVLWVTHDLEQMGRVADEVLVMLDGRVAHRGRPDDLRDSAPGPVLAFLDGGDRADD